MAPITAFTDDIPHIPGLQSALTNVGDDGTATASSGRPRRSANSRRLPGRVRELLRLPQTRAVILPTPVDPVQPPPPTTTQESVPTIADPATANPPLESPVVAGPPNTDPPTRYRTTKNAFGVFREYLRKPLRIPDEDLSLAELTNGGVQDAAGKRDGSGSAQSKPKPRASDAPAPSEEELAKAIHPFPNISTFRIGHWFHTCASSLSRFNLSRLVKEVILSKDFRAGDFEGASMERLDAALDKLDSMPVDASEEETNGEVVGEKQPPWNGWKEESVRIPVPTGVKSSARARGQLASKDFDIPGLFRRQLVDIIRTELESDAANDFHFDPFTTYWDPPEAKPATPPGPFTAPSSSTQIPEPATTPSPSASPDPLPPPPPTRILDELYSSDAWLGEQARLDALPPDPDGLPRAIAGLMFWSDATHLTQFGSAKMWPLYMYFGNQSSWMRSKPSAKACHHVAFIPSVSDSFTTTSAAF